MKFRKKLKMVLEMILIITNIIFGFVWIAGFYYFQKYLAVLSVLVILFIVLNVKTKDDNLLKGSLNQLVIDDEDIYEDEAEFELLQDDEFDDSFFYEDENLTSKANEKLKESLTHKVNLFSIVDRIIDDELLWEEDIYIPQNEYRNFESVVEMLCEFLPEHSIEKLKNEINYWAPEELWECLASFINRNVKKDSNDFASVRIYAILCDCTEVRIRRSFARYGK